MMISSSRSSGASRRVARSLLWDRAGIDSGRRLLRTLGLANRVSIVGLDLVDMFADVPSGLDHMTLKLLSIVKPSQAFDLVTCVHNCTTWEINWASSLVPRRGCSPTATSQHLDEKRQTRRKALFRRSERV
jgi:hypothetical protein